MNNATIPIITIDGPSGVGKGTISLLIASNLGWHILDSGALYRALAYYAVEQAVDLHDELALATLALQLPVRFINTTSSAVQVYLHEVNISAAIKTEYYGNLTSMIAKFPKVRNALLAMQRDFVQAPGLIADGRDMGTVIFPKAQVKFFLEASIAARAKRRYLQLKENGLDVKLEAITKEVAERDRRDRERVVAPMQPAVGAIIIDTTYLTIDQVVSQVLKYINQNSNFG